MSRQTLSQKLEILQSERDALAAEVDRLQSVIEDMTDDISDKELALSEAYDSEEEAWKAADEASNPTEIRPPYRFRLPAERPAVTHKFKIGPSPLGEGFITVGIYPDTNHPGEVFFNVSKGLADFLAHSAKETTSKKYLEEQLGELFSFAKGTLNLLGATISIALQHGVPWEAIANKYRMSRFPPEGRTDNDGIRYAYSIPDYFAQWLVKRFGKE